MLLEADLCQPRRAIRMSGISRSEAQTQVWFRTGLRRLSCR